MLQDSTSTRAARCPRRIEETKIIIESRTVRGWHRISACAADAHIMAQCQGLIDRQISSALSSRYTRMVRLNLRGARAFRSAR